MARKPRSCNEQEKVRNIQLWTGEMDRCLARVLAVEVKKGNKVDNVFKSAAYVAASIAVNKEFGLGLTKEHIRNRLKTWKKQYRILKELLAQKGFGWDEKRKMIVADTSLWNGYIKGHPDARQFWGRSIEHYHEFCTVIGNDQLVVGCFENDAGMDMKFEDTKDVLDQAILFNVQSDDNQTTKIRWTRAMDYYLGKVLAEQVRRGYKRDNVLAPKAYEITLSSLNEKFGPHLTKDNIKNRLKTWRKRYVILKDMLSCAGFKWDTTRKMIVATDILWDSYVKTYPDARVFRGAVIENYENWCIIFGNDYGVAEDVHLPNVDDGYEVKDQVKNMMWTNEMDDCLTKVLVEQVKLGNKSKLGNKLKPRVLVAAVSALNERFQLDLTRDHIKNRLKTWKKQYAILKELLEHSNFKWDETEKMVKATDSAWKQYIRANPGARQLQGRVIKNYDELQIILGYDDLPESSLNGTDDNLNLNAGNEAAENTYCGWSDIAKRKWKYVSWTEEMDRCLAEQLIEQVVLGNKLENSFKPVAFEAALAVLNSKFSLDLTVEDIRYRLKTWKKEYGLVKELLSDNGFEWDERQKMVIADDSEWNKYIERNPALSSVRARPIENYTELCILVGDEQSSGFESENGNGVADLAQIDKNHLETPVELVFDEETSHDDADDNDKEAIRLLSETENGARNPLQNEEELLETPLEVAGNEEMRQGVTDDNTQASSQQTGARLTSSSQSKQAFKRRQTNNPMLEMMTAIAANTSRIADALTESNSATLLDEAFSTVQTIPEFDDDLIIDACEFLSVDEKRARMFMKLNDRLRKKWLLKRLRGCLGRKTLLNLTKFPGRHKPFSTAAVFPTADDLLALSSDAISLLQAKQIHACAILNGHLPVNGAVCASLILRYADFNAPSTSRILFEQTIPYDHTAFLWNTLIRALSVARVSESFDTYNRMFRIGVRPNDRTFPLALKICADDFDVAKGMEIHGCLIKMGFYCDVFVGNTLLLFYGNNGVWRDAEKVFDEMRERDVVTWNTVIGMLSVNGFYFKALRLFCEMISRSAYKPNMVTVVSVLPACAEVRDEGMTRQIHGYVLKVGLDSQVRIGNALVDAYGKCGNVKALKQVFDEMEDRNEVSWNAVINSLAYAGFNKDALGAFRLMMKAGLRPDSISFTTILPVLVGMEFFNLGKEIHGFSLRIGVESDVFIANSLIDMYAKSGHPTEALNVFQQMHLKTVVSWNAMVANFTQNGQELAAIELVRKMQVHGETPDSFTLTNVLPACGRLGFLRTGKEIHGRTFRMGSSLDLFVSNALTDMYAKCGRLNLAKNLFDISSRDEISYNIMILGYSRTSDASKSVSLFSEMGLIGLKHDMVSFVGVISACANLATLKQGKEIHGLLVRKHFHKHLFIANSLLDFYTKCGRIDIAHKVFDRIPHKDVASWNTMVLGYGMLGKVDVAIKFFEGMREDGVECDSVSYITILSVCSHGGLVEKGRKYYEEMKALNIKPTEMHYACMVDLLGRAGLLEEAAELIKNLPIIPDANIWGAMLGACRIFGNIELATWAAEHLFMLKPQHSGYYTILSNMLAEVGKWDEANRVRELMKLKGARKNPGCSWVQVQDQVHAFVVEDRMKKLDPALWLACSS
ncbi:hypothetical protein SLE2022_352080 [Rubroshorea leprosula]